MIRIANQIRLSPKERGFLEGLVQEPVNPRTVADYNAWIDQGIAGFSEDDPEERLYKRAIEGMRIAE
jgi:hypothetical protein